MSINGYVEDRLKILETKRDMLSNEYEKWYRWSCSIAFIDNGTVLELRNHCKDESIRYMDMLAACDAEIQANKKLII